MRNGQNVGVVCGGWVGSGALEQNQVFATSLAGGTYGVIQFGDAGHARRNNHRFTSGGDASYQRQVSVLKCGDFVARHFQTFQQVYRSIVKRSTECDYVQFTRPLENRFMPFPRGICLAV